METLFLYNFISHRLEFLFSKSWTRSLISKSKYKKRYKRRVKKRKKKRENETPSDYYVVCLEIIMMVVNVIDEGVTSRQVIKIKMVKLFRSGVWF